MCVSFTTVGFGDISAETGTEIVFVVLVQWIGAVVFAFLITNLQEVNLYLIILGVRARGYEPIFKEYSLVFRAWVALLVANTHAHMCVCGNMLKTRDVHRCTSGGTPVFSGTQRTARAVR